MSLYWKANFATGDLSELTLNSGGAAAAWPDALAGTVTVVNDRAYASQYSCRVNVADTLDLVNRSLYLARWAEGRNLSEFYYGVALYLPTDFSTPVPAWANIASIAEADAPYQNFAYITVAGAGVDMRVAVASTVGGVFAVLWQSTVPPPLDRWFTVVMYYRGGVSGNIKCWIDGAQVADWSADLSSSASIGPEISAGIGGSDLPAGIEVLVDEMKAASTYELALPVPSVIPPPPLQHTLSITTVPSGISFTLVKL